MATKVRFRCWKDWRQSENGRVYIGSTAGPKGLHHRSAEIVDNAIDEALAGFCTEIVTLPGKRDPCSDNGRGIRWASTQKRASRRQPSTAHHPPLMPAVKFGGGAGVSGGLHGVGIRCNALSGMAGNSPSRTAATSTSREFNQGRLQRTHPHHRRHH